MEVFSVHWYFHSVLTLSSSASICCSRAGFSSSKNTRSRGPMYMYAVDRTLMAATLTACVPEQKATHHHQQCPLHKHAVTTRCHLLQPTHHTTTELQDRTTKHEKLQSSVGYNGQNNIRQWGGKKKEQKGFENKFKSILHE